MQAHLATRLAKAMGIVTARFLTARGPLTTYESSQHYCDISYVKQTGSPIVSEKWVDACARSDAFVGAKEFLLKDPAAEKKFGFSLAAAYEAAQQSLLLDGMHVFLTPGEGSGCSHLLIHVIERARLHGSMLAHCSRSVLCVQQELLER